MTEGVVLSAAASNNLLAIKRAESLVDRTSLRLSTGFDVNTALDDPDNFFTSKSLSNRSSDLQRLLDGLGRSILSIKTALQAVDSLGQLIDQADSIATESQRLFELGQIDPEIYEFELDSTLSPLSSQIQGDDPVGYWRLNDGGGPAVNLGSGGAALNATYQGGVTLGAAGLYDNAPGDSADFNGTNGRLLVPNSALINLNAVSERTIEMVFNADTVAGRQVLWEEGGGVNALNIYIDNGTLYFFARDQGDFQVSVTAPVVAGQTYHVALVFDEPSGELRGYVDGALVGTDPGVTRTLSPHSGAVGIGSTQGSTFMHDGNSPNNTHRFNGRISDVALYNSILSDADIDRHARSLEITTEIEFRHRQFENVLQQINDLVSDASFRGISLLNDMDIITDFNEQRTSSLVTEGVDFTAEGLRLIRNNFNDADDLQNVIESVRQAREVVRAYGTSLVNDLNIIQTREAFINSMRVTLDDGARDLVIADQNEEGANLLSAQTRLNLAQTALRLARNSQLSILRLFS